MMRAIVASSMGPVSQAGSLEVINITNAQIAAPDGDRSRGWDGRAAIKVFHCFHQDNDGSKCEVAHTSLPIRPSKSPAHLVLGRVLVPAR